MDQITTVNNEPGLVRAKVAAAFSAHDVIGGMLEFRKHIPFSGSVAREDKWNIVETRPVGEKITAADLILNHAAHDLTSNCTVRVRLLDRNGSEVDTVEQIAQEFADEAEYYGWWCMISLHRHRFPRAGVGIGKGFLYEDNGAQCRVFDFYSDQDTDIAGWRHSPELGWSFTVRPFDIVQEADKRRVREGRIVWHPLGSAAVSLSNTPDVSLFVAAAVNAISNHPRTPHMRTGGDA